MPNKFKIGNLRKPTPRKWRKFGNALVAAGMVAGSYAFVNQNEFVGIAVVAVAFVGKFIAEMATEEKPKENEETN